MTLPIERARSRRPVTWLTIIGVILLPAIIGGILVAALYNPTERLDNLTAAIVNNDEPVTINGQTAPLGRQLTAGLVKGSDDVPSNLDWTISNTDDAKKGLADGTYAAVITIPANFSASATSTQPGATPEKATIGVQTAPDALIVDDAITQQVTQAAASLMGQQLSQIYLENVFLGFTTLGDQLGQAADGATQLASGARDAAGGATSLADGVRQLASGSSSLASGASTWAAGADKAADGLDQWASGAGKTAAGVSTIAQNLKPIGDALAASPQIPQQVVDAANGIASNSAQIKTSVQTTADQLAQAAADCAAQGGSASLCAAVQQASDSANAALPQLNGVIDQSGQIAQGVQGLQQLPALGAGLQQMAAGLTDASNGMNALASGATGAASGVRQLADGATGISSGAAQLATGAGRAADGADTLGTGVGQLADGTDSLASGLHQASDSLPSYTDDQAKSLATVVSDPVTAGAASTTLFGASAIPLLAMLALWFGGLGTFIALQAVSRRALTSRASSAGLALRALAPAAGIGAIQGLLVAGVVQLAASYTWSEWSVFAGVAVIAGVAFAAVNQAFVALLGGAGRWISALIGVLAVATGIVSTVPGVMSQIAGLLPTAPAYNAMLAALGPATGVAAGVVGLAIWALLGFIVTVVAVGRKRTTSARALLTASPAPA